jgi:hypothetical protein
VLDRHFCPIECHCELSGNSPVSLSNDARDHFHGRRGGNRMMAPADEQHSGQQKQESIAARLRHELVTRQS